MFWILSKDGKFEEILEWIRVFLFFIFRHVILIPENNILIKRKNVFLKEICIYSIQISFKNASFLLIRK